MIILKEKCVCSSFILTLQLIIEMSLEGIEKGLQVTTTILLDLEAALRTISENLERIEVAMPIGIDTDKIEASLESIDKALWAIAEKS